MGPAHHRHPHTHGDADDDVEAILDALRADGGRVTTGRRAIVRALFTGPDHHVTADDVAALVQADHPDVHLSTVYRTLESLEALGVVDRVNLGAGPAVYHLTDHVHHHLVCDAVRRRHRGPARPARGPRPCARPGVRVRGLRPPPVDRRPLRSLPQAAAG